MKKKKHPILLNQKKLLTDHKLFAEQSMYCFTYSMNDFYEFVEGIRCVLSISSEIPSRVFFCFVELFSFVLSILFTTLSIVIISFVLSVTVSGYGESNQIGANRLSHKLSLWGRDTRVIAKCIGRKESVVFEIR